MRPISPEEAYAAVETFEVMSYFGQMSFASKTILAEELEALVNTPGNIPLKNSHGVVITVPPVVRLERFVKAFRRLPGGWPGISEMGAIYQQMFPPGDGVTRPTPTIEGFTGEDNAAGSYIALTAPEDVAPLQIEAPAEKIPEVEAREIEEKFAALRQRMITGKEN